MNSKLFFILLLVIAGAAIFGSSVKSKIKTSQTASAVSQFDEPSNELDTQSKTMGVVSVDVTPLSTENNKAVVFELAMNNHSVDLGYDYTEIATLRDDQGNIYKPTEWSGNSGGHHIRGQLIFPVLISRSKNLTLTLNGVDNETADFSWQL